MKKRVIILFVLSMFVFLSACSISQIDSGDGYYKLPDGTLYQWGKINIGLDTDRATVNFQIPFKEAPTVLMTVEENGNPAEAVAIFAFNTTASQVTAFNRLNSVSRSYDIPVYWTAIGRWK